MGWRGVDVQESRMAEWGWRMFETELEGGEGYKKDDCAINMFFLFVKDGKREGERGWREIEERERNRR